MKIKLKESLELIPLDDDSMAIFDPTDETTHFFEGTGYSIVKAVADGITESDSLIAALCEEYSATYDEIYEDAVSFLQRLVDMKVMIAL